MVSILQFIRGKTHFDDDATSAMGAAFDAACKSLSDRGQPQIVRKSSLSGLSRPRRRASAIRSAYAIPVSCISGS